MTTKKQRHAEVQKRACKSNVQAVTPVQAGVGMRCFELTIVQTGDFSHSWKK